MLVIEVMGFELELRATSLPLCHGLVGSCAFTEINLNFFCSFSVQWAVAWAACHTDVWASRGTPTPTTCSTTTTCPHCHPTEEPAPIRRTPIWQLMDLPLDQGLDLTVRNDQDSVFQCKIGSNFNPISHPSCAGGNSVLLMSNGIDLHPSKSLNRILGELTLPDDILCLFTGFRTRLEHS